MSKKKMGMIVGALTVTLLLGVAAILLLLNPKEEVEPDIYVQVIGREASQVSNISIQNEYGQYEIVKTGENTWEVPSLQGVTTSKNSLQQAIEYAATLRADKLIATTFENGEQYGVGDVCATSVITFTDGTSTTLEFFSQLENDSGYYFTVGGTTNIYRTITTNPVKYFVSSNTALVDLTISPFKEANSLDSLNFVEIVNKNGTFTIQNMSENVFDGFGNMYRYKVSGTYDGYLTTRFFYDNMPDLRDFTASSTVKVFPTEEDLKNFGLDKPQSSLRMSNGTNEVTMLIGNGDKSGHYIMIEGNPAVFRLVSSAVTWLNYDYEDICSPFLMAPLMEQTQKVSVDIGDKKYEFIIGADSVTCNGQSVDFAQFKNMFKLLCSVTRDDVYTEAAPSSYDARITFTTDGAEQSIAFAKVGRKLAVNVDGTCKYTCRKAFLDALEQGIQNLLDGKNVSYQW